MKPVTRILFVEEIASQLRMSIPSIRRYLQASRRGRGNFPLPISPPGGKLRFLASDIEAYLASQSVAPSATSSIRQTKRDQKEFHQRQAAAEETLRRHRKSK